MFLSMFYHIFSSSIRTQDEPRRNFRVLKRYELWELKSKGNVNQNRPFENPSDSLLEPEPCREKMDDAHSLPSTVISDGKLKLSPQLYHKMVHYAKLFNTVHTDDIWWSKRGKSAFCVPDILYCFK